MRGVLDRFHNDYHAAYEAEQEALRYARDTHTSMPPNYWEERWRAEQKLKAALAVVEALREPQ